MLLEGFDSSLYGSLAPPSGKLNPLVMTQDRLYPEPENSFRSSSLSSTHTDSPALIRPAMLLPGQQSTYSELSANLAYLSSLSEATSRMSCDGNKCFERQRDLEKVREVTEDKTVKLVDASAGEFPSKFDWPSREKPARKSLVASGTKYSVKHATPDVLRGRISKLKGAPPKRIPLPYGIGKTSGTSPSTGKKLGLACLFCRERKIACGRPSESNSDQTCK